MDYLIISLTALLTFISPCVLPLLPIYVSYFVAGESNRRRTLINALGFAVGLMVVLAVIGVISTALGLALRSVINQYKWIFDLVSGLIIIVLGLNFIGLIKIPFLSGSRNINVKTENMTFFSAIIFGLVYGISFGPCVIAFQSVSIFSAISEAINSGNMLKGIFLQLTYGITLSALFVISAMLIDLLKGVFSFIKRHYRTINTISGIILIILGILMATGVMTMIMTL